tara:strand:- start:2561 stop:2968 length:408 start_codon:yes stop_codon:yes gene_type:complete
MSNSVEFTGMSSEMRESQWLASEDIEDKGGSVVVTISACFRHEDVMFEAGRVAAVAFSLRFENATKELVLNATNRDTLRSLFGKDVRNWKTKKIELYVKSGIKMRGKTVTGIRIREVKDDGKKGKGKATEATGDG